MTENVILYNQNTDGNFNSLLNDYVSIDLI